MPFLAHAALPRGPLHGGLPDHDPVGGGSDDPVSAAIDRLWGNAALGVPFAHGADLLAWWRAACGERAMPAPRDFDPLAVPAAAAWLVLIDPPGTAAAATRYRLFGAGVARVLGAERTGRVLSRPADRFDAALAALAAAVAERRAPVLRPARTEVPGGPADWTLLGLPLGEGRSVRRVAVAVGRDGAWT